MEALATGTNFVALLLGLVGFGMLFDFLTQTKRGPAHNAPGTFRSITGFILVEASFVLQLGAIALRWLSENTGVAQGLIAIGLFSLIVYAVVRGCLHYRNRAHYHRHCQLEQAVW